MGVKSMVSTTSIPIRLAPPPTDSIISHPQLRHLPPTQALIIYIPSRNRKSCRLFSAFNPLKRTYNAPSLISISDCSLLLRLPQRRAIMVFTHFRARPLHLTLQTFKLLCAVHLFQTHVFAIGATSGPSMCPTFAVDGDWVATDMTHARNRKKELRIGDLVQYRIPILENADGIKRLVGLPGDYVSMGTPGERGEDQMIQVSPVARETPQLTIPQTQRRLTRQQVPEGHCWVLGDNLTASRDSRIFGPLPLALIKGKVVARVLPYGQSGWLENPMQPLDMP
jgi:mitochondrial inner membrane protease subunit 1